MVIMFINVSCVPIPTVKLITFKGTINWLGAAPGDPHHF